MLQLLFLIFFISPLGKCVELEDFCGFPPLEEICAAVKFISVIAEIFGFSMSEYDDGNQEKLDEISDLRKQMEEDHLETMTKLELITGLMKNLPVEIKLDHQKELLASFVTTVDDTFDEFLSALEQKEVEFLKEYGHQFIYDKSRDLDDLRNRLVSPSAVSSVNEGFFPTLTQSLTYENRICTGNLSVQEILISMWRMVVKAEIKLYLLLKAFYQISLKKRAFRKRVRRLNFKANQNLLAYSRAVRRSLKTAHDVPHEACDPENNNWIEDVSFYHLDGLHMPAMFHHVSTCLIRSCSEMIETDKCGWRWIHAQLSCDEDVYSCAPAGEISACISTRGKRMINWLESSKLGRAGFADDSCPRNSAVKVKAKTGWSEFMPLNACLCYCRRKIPEIHTGEMKTKASDNYVVTGVRFIRNTDGVLFLQPQEGKLGVYGQISDFSWVDLPEIDETNSAVIIDDQKIIFLDDLRLPPGHVMTGISLSFMGNRNDLSGFGLIIVGTPYDYKTGKLNLDSGNDQKISATSDETEELKVKLFNPINTDMIEPMRPSSPDYNYVALSPSEYADDVGASFLPLINAVPVTSQHSPLTGIRLFHKGSDEHAGFISLGVHQAHYVELLDELIENYAKNGTQIWKAGIMKRNIFV